MALRFMQLGTKVRSTFDYNKVGLWAPLNQTLWNLSSSSSGSCYLHRHHGSSTPGSTLGDVSKIQVRSCRVLHAGTSVYKGAQTDEWIITLAKFAVDKHNEKQNAHLRFVRVIGASHSGASSLLYHITLEVTEARRQKIYHTVVWLQLWRNLMELLVLKRVNDALSAIGIKLGDLKLHEAVMFYMNHMNKDLPLN